MTAALSSTSVLRQERTTVRASEFLDALAEHARGLKVLSLDCFDTLLFRRTATPIDVFFQLQHAPEFRELGFNAKLRAGAETTARELSQVRRGTFEVRLADIYRAAFPELGDEQVRSLAAAEIEVEKRACYAFAPTVDLMRAARARGLRIALVSDTYFDEKQLRQLLSAALGERDLALIDKIFCSNAFGRSKVNGLFGEVIGKLSVSSSAILHIGDNESADVIAPRSAGVRALHFVHHDQPVQDILRWQAAAGALLVPTLRQTAGVPSPYRGLLAADKPDVDAAYLLGYAAAGPIFYGFARFVLDEIESLRQNGKEPKVGFLLRDGFLPSEICQTVAGARVGSEIAVSRFAAYASTFRTLGDVERYLAASAGSRRYEAMAKQLLLPADLARSICDKSSAAKDGETCFVNLVRKPDVLALIFGASKAYRTRLFRYLERELGLTRGDTLVFVDLGYDGTAQRLLEPVLRDELGVELLGLYLLLARTPGWQHSRKGLVDPSWCDDRVVASLVPYIALIEDLCACDAGSVRDYDDEGAAIFDAKVLASGQYEQVKPVQDMCRTFAATAERFFERIGERPDRESLRTTSLAAIGRLLFFPTAQEISFLEGFRLDVNMGTDDSVGLFDLATGLGQLRRRGLFFGDKKGAVSRTNGPVELRHAGAELSLALLMQHRYSLEFAQSDATLRRETLRLLVVMGSDATTTELEAHATHDGYFALLVPVGRGDMNFGVLFGERYTWVQIDHIERIPTAMLFKPDEARHTESVLASVKPEQMVMRAPGLYECLSDSAFLFLPPAGTRGSGRGTFVCRVVFRPVARRSAAKST
jgi:FMN phosphatase YigB (HAD superfamily)